MDLRIGFHLPPADPLTAAAERGATAVHGGHLPESDDVEEGYANWRATLERLETTVPILIENTAGGSNAIARHVDRIDLVHLNDSKDEAGCGRDRHELLGKGQIDEEALVAVVTEARADVILEVPGDAAEHRAQLAWIRDRLG
jgi:deoxyribonuclease-4